MPSDVNKIFEELDDLKTYNAEQVGAFLSLSRRSVLEYARKGRLKGVKIGGKWLFTGEAIRELLRG